MLVGQQVPYTYKYDAPSQEKEVWKGIKQNLKSRALAAMPQEEALEIIRSDGWAWRPGFYESASSW
jgi:hypothetical protein